MLMDFITSVQIQLKDKEKSRSFTIYGIELDKLYEDFKYVAEAIMEANRRQSQEYSIKILRGNREWIIEN